MSCDAFYASRNVLTELQDIRKEQAQILSNQRALLEAFKQISKQIAAISALVIPAPLEKPAPGIKR